MSSNSFKTNEDDKSDIEKQSSDDSSGSLSGLNAALEVAGVALVIFDPDDKLLSCTEEYISMNEDIGAHIVPAASF